ncbi:MAG: imidazole glycerol phosphate synthase subunit HisH [Anaerolineae bacterium]|nr:imidazole glycerol phosphate synthase subunit HisH [Anaerolineae bacterium]
MIALIDYGAGNVRSVHKALLAVGGSVQLTQAPDVVRAADKVVLPGVGAFADCMMSLERLDLLASIHEVVARGVPFLGICVGMQVLFEYGEELGGYPGLGLLPGRVVPFSIDPVYKVPHTGWNLVEPVVPSPLLNGLPTRTWTYFNHGFHCEAAPDDILATTDYGGPFASVVGRGKLYGVQFHPEKSQQLGLHILRNFVAMEVYA